MRLPPVTYTCRVCNLRNYQPTLEVVRINSLFANAGVFSRTQNKVDVVQKVVDSSTVHAAPRLPINHTGNDRTHGEDVTDVPCVADDSVVKQPPPPVTMQPPADAYTGCADCLCCFRPCHKHVKIHPEEQVIRKIAAITFALLKTLL